MYITFCIVSKTIVLSNLRDDRRRFEERNPARRAHSFITHR